MSAKMTVATAFTAVEKPTQDAQQVQAYAARTLDLVTRWIERAEKNPNEPVCRWVDSAHLRKARQANRGQGQPHLADAGVDDEAVFAFLEQTLQDSVNPWTRRFLDKLFSTPTTMSPALDMMIGALNVTAAVSTASPALCLAEEEAVEGLARILGWDDARCDGLTMPGGSASNVLAVQTALGNVFPSFKSEGVLGIAADLHAQGRRGRAARPLLLTSANSHYSYEKACLGCGLGLNSVVKVPCDSTGRMDTVELNRILDEAFSNTDGTTPGAVAGYPFLIGTTSGTTILGAFDDIEAAVQAAHSRRQYGKIWVHVDGSWGGPAIFSQRTRRLFRGIERADSFTINPHKVLNVTQQCSFALFRDGSTLAANVTDAKYLFHGTTSGPPTREILRRNPASKTMGCARRPDAFKFYVAWLRSGTAGFGEHVDKGVDFARRVVEMVETVDTLQLSETRPCTEDTFLNVNFRPRPSPEVQLRLEGQARDLSTRLDASAESLMARLYSKATLHVHESLAREGRYLVDRAPLSGSHGPGYYTRLITHPNTDWAILKAVVLEVDRLGRHFFDACLAQGPEALARLLGEEDD
ncbi:unnamed protein product [Parajaminaea phylloscopi]